MVGLAVRNSEIFLVAIRREALIMEEALHFGGMQLNLRNLGGKEGRKRQN